MTVDIEGEGREDASTAGGSAPSPPGSEKEFPGEDHTIVNLEKPDETVPQQTLQPLEPVRSENDLSPKLSTLRFSLLALGLCSGLFLALLDTSIVATSLYSIAVEFEAIENINWVALAYTLTYLGCAVLFAHISDIVGRRAAFLAGYALFMAFSLGCGFAQDLNQLIAFRALQGLGGSCLFSVTMIILPEVTPDSGKRFIGSLIGIVIAISGVLGPVLGGIFTHYATWRWVFWFNGPVGGLSAGIFILAWPDKKYLPKMERRAWKDLDYLGSVLLIAAAVLIVFSFQNAGADTDQWTRPIFVCPLIFGLVALVALVAWQLFIERRWAGKMAGALPLVLLRNRVYMGGVLTASLTCFPYFIAIYAFPTRFQVVNGKSPLEAGVMMLPMLAGAAFGSVLAGVLNGKQNRVFEILVLACSLMLVGCGLETMASSEAGVDAKELGFMAFIGLGFGLSASATTFLANLETPIHEHASGQAVLSQTRIMGGSIGIAASSAILSVKAQAELSGVLTPLEISTLGHSTLTAVQEAAVRQAYTDAFREDMIVSCAVLGLALVMTVLVYRRHRLSLKETQKARYIAERERRRKKAGPERPAKDTDTGGAV